VRTARHFCLAQEESRLRIPAQLNGHKVSQAHFDNLRYKNFYSPRLAVWRKSKQAPGPLPAARKREES
jgi:hypothetical protein